MLLVLIGLVLLVEALRFVVGDMLSGSKLPIPAWVLSLIILSLAFVFAGMMTGMGGVLIAIQLRSVSPVMGGISLVLNVLAATLIGGTSPFGKSGWLVGSVVASIGIAALYNGLILENVESYNNDIIVGSLVLVWLLLYSASKLLVDYTRPKAVSE
jgi:ribose/xylose/arabinose/galactoside ABC-type transport system permease subunit